MVQPTRAAAANAVMLGAVDQRYLFALLDALADAARAAGLKAYILSDEIEGESREVGKVHAALARAVAQNDPKNFTAALPKAQRKGRIFVDYLRNGRGATAVASYSLRGRPGAPVAMPLAWSELAKLKRADAFTITDVPPKLKRRRRDPWEGIDSLSQNLARWAQEE